jgi:hypothetical protein
MHDDEIGEDLEALYINMQVVVQLWSKHREQETKKERPLTPQNFVSVARVTDVVKILSLTDLCGQLVKVKTLEATKVLLQCKCCQRYGHTQRKCGYAPRCVVCGNSQPSQVV